MELDAAELDFDAFGVPESGKTIASLGKQVPNEGILAGMEFSLTESARGAIDSIEKTDRDSNGIMEPQMNHRMMENVGQQQQRSASRAIPTGQSPQQASPSPALAGIAAHSLPSSVGSSGSAFLNNHWDPAVTSLNGAPFSHTPPNHVATSYEASHFGKRARSGSISERLRVSSELEQKGLIDRDQKGILKDLIISGQDSELQHALDKYESGDPSFLENMLRNGALDNKATADIDLLGDLDLDFLNVNDPTSHIAAQQQSTYTTGAYHQAMQPPAPLPTRIQEQEAVAMVSPYEASDGIGELDFDGGIGRDEFVPIPAHERDPTPYHSYAAGQRSRSNSTFSQDIDFRSRSNSLFSALIGPVPEEGSTSEYGRWMDPSQQPVRVMRRSSAPEIPTTSELSRIMDAHDVADTPMLTKREIRAEEKRRAKLEKKEQKEKEKQEKKEKREQAKLAKQKEDDMDEKEEHIPGSGRPRSMSDPNIRTSLDSDGLLAVERPDGWIGAYSPQSRKVRIERFLEKRNHRVWTKTVKYDVRKNFADSRLRVKGRFVKKEDEVLMRELMSMT